MRNKNRIYKHKSTTKFIKNHLQDVNQRVAVSMINNGNPFTFIEEPDVQPSTEIIEESPTSLLIEEPEVRLSTEIIEENPTSLLIEKPGVQLSAEVTEELPPIFHYIHKTNSQLLNDVAELRKDVEILRQLINEIEILGQDVRTEINPSLELLKRRSDATSEQMIVQQQKIDEMVKLLYWKPKNHHGS